MHSIQSLAHRAPPAAATRTRVRWQPYASTPSAVLATNTKSPAAAYLNIPTSSSIFPSISDLERVRQSTQLSQQSTPSTSKPLNNPKAKYALGLVDQAVKVLGDVWRPHDIPEVFTTTRASASASLCSDLTVSMVQTSIVAPTCPSFGRNNQLPSPSQSSPPHFHTTSYCTEIQIEQSPECRKSLIPVRAFIQEVLKRSKTTGSVLQTALCYLEAIRPKVSDLAELEKNGQGIRGEPESVDRIVQGTQEDLEASLGMDFNLQLDAAQASLLTDADTDCAMVKTIVDDQTLKRPQAVSGPLTPMPPLPSPLLCPRRAFLASLILASKFMHDKSYSNRAWAKLSGLSPREISRCERALGDALGWRLWVGKVPVSETAPVVSVPRGIVRCRSESNLAAAHVSGPFLAAPVETTSPPTGRMLRRCSTVPNNAFDQPMVAEARSNWSSDATMPASLYLSDSSPQTPGLSYSPSSTASSSGDSAGDKTIQMSFLEDNMTPTVNIDSTFYSEWPGNSVDSGMCIDPSFPFTSGKACGMSSSQSNIFVRIPSEILGASGPISHVPDFIQV